MQKITGPFATLWRFMAWLWPAAMIGLYILISSFDRSGWEVLILLFASPFITLVSGLLGVLMLYVLKRRGFKRVPSSVAFLLVAHWSFLFTSMLSIVGAGDSGSFPSTVYKLFPILGQDGQSMWQMFALFGIIGTHFVALVLTFFVKPKEQAKSRTTLLLIAAVTPLFLTFIVSFSFTVFKSFGEEGASGSRAIDALFLSEEKVKSQQIARYEVAQQETALLRAEIAPDKWLLHQFGGVKTYKYPSYSKKYDVSTGWIRNYDADAVDVYLFVSEKAAGLGWSLVEEQESPEGHTREVSRTGAIEEAYRAGTFTKGDFTLRIFVQNKIYEHPDEAGETVSSSQLELILDYGPFWQNEKGANWYDGDLQALNRPIIDDPSYFFTSNSWLDLEMTQNVSNLLFTRDDTAPTFLGVLPG